MGNEGVERPRERESEFGVGRLESKGEKGKGWGS